MFTFFHFVTHGVAGFFLAVALFLNPSATTSSSTPTISHPVTFASSTYVKASSRTPVSQTLSQIKKNVPASPQAKPTHHIVESSSAPASLLSHVVTSPTLGTTSTSGTSAAITTPGTGMSPIAFIQMMENIEQTQLKDNPYLKEKAILIHGMFNGPLSQADIAQLSPDVASVYQQGNKDAIELQVEALNQLASNYDIKIEQGDQTLINNYSLQVGLPITQLPPVQTTCNWVGLGMVNCVTQ